MVEHEEAGDGPTIIEPVDFRATRPARRRKASLARRIAVFFCLLLTAGLFASAWFVLSAKRIEIAFEPPADAVVLTGPPPRVPVGERYLLRPGTYEVAATLPGFHPLRESFVVGPDGPRRFEFAFRELPGIVAVRCIGADDPATALEDVAVAIDGTDVGRTPLGELELEPGLHAVRLVRDRYQPLDAEITVSGRGRRQELAFELRPDWAVVEVEAAPVPAVLTVDGRVIGPTPQRLELPSGPHELELRAERFEPWRRAVEVVAEQPLTLTGELTPARGTLTVVTEPPGAQVLVDGAYAGISPVDAQVPPDQDVVIRVARPGYDPARTTARVGPGDATTIELALTAQLGTVRLEVEPADAILLVDGARLGTVPPEITLTAEEHRIELQREGYRPAVRTVTPRPGVMQTVEVRLEAIETPVARLAKQIKAGDGIPLVLVRPGTYTMGASRREQGRRSNETLRAVALTRPFYFGAREITNAEFKTFNADHDSGFVEATTLATASQPVAMVTWDDAARFCNWLSARDGLPAAYVEDGDSMRAVRPVTSGYRLPTEAEWEFVARSNGGNPMKYPWGGDYPPRGKAGNFADESASKLLGRVIESYEDGHVGSAPVASFAANGRGVHDLGGNVAEWCHDFYTIYSYDAEEVATDPAGPEQGEHHVIRGSSWRHSSISALRCSYRDYGAGRRDDLGFRICRYLTSEEASIENEAHQ